MAGVPCVNTTCSVNSTADNNGRLNLTVINSPTGGLTCVDGQGESIVVDPSASNLLSVGAAGLLANRTSAQIVVRGAGGVRKDYPAGSQTENSANFRITNSSTSLTRMMIVETKYRYQFTRDVGSYYWTDGTFQTNVGSASGIDNVAQTFSVAGPQLLTPEGTSGSDVKAIEEFWTKFYFLNPGEDAQITSFATSREGYNAVSTGGSNGFTAFHNVMLVDIVFTGSGLGSYAPL